MAPYRHDHHGDPRQLRFTAGPRGSEFPEGRDRPSVHRHRRRLPRLRDPGRGDRRYGAHDHRARDRLRVRRPARDDRGPEGQRRPLRERRRRGGLGLANLLRYARRDACHALPAQVHEGSNAMTRDATYRKLGKICMTFPEVEMKPFGGHVVPCWRVRDKIFVGTGQTERPRMNVKAAPGEQQALIASDPERFYVPQYTGTKGWVGVWLDNKPDWDE